MTTEEAELAKELLHKIKVAKIQINNFKQIDTKSSARFVMDDTHLGKDNAFSIGENIENGNSKLLLKIKEVAILYLEDLLKNTEDELSKL